MNTSYLIAPLQATNSANNEERNAAEKFLAQNAKTPGFFPSLLAIVADQSSSKSLKQAAAIALKNRFRNAYKSTPDDDNYCNDEDKSVIKQNVIGVICSQADSSVVQLIGFIIREVAKEDFPNNWPQFQPQVETYLSSNNPASVYNALFVIKEVFAQLEYKEDSREVIKGMFNYFYQTFINFLAVAVNQEDGYKICHIILKIYNKYLYGLVKYDADEVINFDQITQWVQILCTILVHPASPIPEDITVDEYKELPWWNTKTKAMKILNRLQCQLARKPNKDDIQDNDSSVIHKHTCIKFLHTLSPTLFNTVIQELMNYNQGAPCGEQLLCEYFDFLSEIVNISSLYRELKKHLSFIFMELSPKLLQLTPQELELWTDEPTDFITRFYNTDSLYESTSIRNEVSEFISHISKVRAGNILSDYVTFLVQILDQYNATPVESRNYIQKEWVLSVLGLLSSNLISKSAFKGNLEIFLNKHVYPEFSSSYGILRARACLTYRDYSRVTLNPEHFNHVVEKILLCLQDSELPVQVAAASTLEIFITNESCRELIRPHISPILTIFITIMNKLGVQEVIDTLDDIATHFEDEIVPICGQLVAELMKSVEGLLTSADPEDNEDNLINADNRLQVVSTLVGYLENHRELYSSLLQILYPYMQNLLNPQYIDIIDSVINILTCFLLYSVHYCDELYQLYPSLVTFLSHGAIDYCADAFNIFNLYISNDAAKFCSLSINDVSYIDLTLEFVKDGLQELGPTEQTYLYMIELIIIHNCMSTCPYLLDRILRSLFVDLDAVIREMNSLEAESKSGIADEYIQYDIEDNNVLLSRILINIESCIVLLPNESLTIIASILPLTEFLQLLMKYEAIHTSVVELHCYSSCLSTLISMNWANYQIDISPYLSKLIFVDVNMMIKLGTVSEDVNPNNNEDSVDFDALERKLCNEHFDDDDWGFDENNDVDETKDDIINQLTDAELNYLVNMNDNSIKDLDKDFLSPFVNSDPTDHFRNCINNAKNMNEMLLMTAVGQLPDMCKESYNVYMSTQN